MPPLRPSSFRLPAHQDWQIIDSNPPPHIHLRSESPHPRLSPFRSHLHCCHHHSDQPTSFVVEITIELR
ncbi:hypothetical protein LINPERHAP1_LOCUS36609 [Linum perenne]